MSPQGTSSGRWLTRNWWTVQHTHVSMIFFLGNLLRYSSTTAGTISLQNPQTNCITTYSSLLNINDMPATYFPTTVLMLHNTRNVHPIARLCSDTSIFQPKDCFSLTIAFATVENHNHGHTILLTQNAHKITSWSYDIELSATENNQHFQSSHFVKWILSLLWGYAWCK
jgi:hypothetical protein